MAFQKGISGNSKGRPPGATLASRLRKTMATELDDIIGAMIQKAREGDTAAASLLLNRVIPALRPVQEPVVIDLGEGSLSDKAGAILNAISAGRMAPIDGKELLSALGAVAKIIEIDGLIKRVELLERAQK
ncbi:MAG: DUF5681 domain-containing protein [Methylococcaceae bacterium]|nr:DUF5681 domain-containing protein [Methylococcaceae bacterium]